MNQRFLYVSNNDHSCLLPHLKEELSLDCDVANNRYEVERALETRQYAGVFMADLALAPGVLNAGETWSGKLMDAYRIGIEVAKKIKERGLPLIVLSSHAIDFREELKRIGVDRVLSKPACLEDYLTALKQLFQR